MRALLLALLLFPNQVFPHGEDRPGPNGGWIRMPGAFHTELVPVGKDSAKIFLLDMNWKNPLVRDSELELRHLKTGKASCNSRKNHFLCRFPAGTDLSGPGSLELKARRGSQQGVAVSYPLPFPAPVAAH